MAANTLPPVASCKAGCAQRVITPHLGVSLAGYFHDRVARYVRDDLFARAMVIEQGGERVALVSCDLICMTEEVADAAKALIAREVGIAAERTLICATHTHTGPELRANGVIPRDEEWVAALPRRIADAVAAAASVLVPATLRPGQTEATGYSFNRLFRLKDGTEVFGARHPEQIIATAGPIDPRLQTLSVVDEKGQLLGVAVNFALHPDVIGGAKADFISADWPGELGRAISTLYGDHVVTVFLQGTCGDINHRPHQPTHLPTSGPAKSVQIGRGLAGAAIHALERAEPMAVSPLAGRLETLSVPYYTREPALLAEIAALKAKETRTPSEEYLVKRTEEWPYDGKEASVVVQALRIGEVAVVGLPAEIFVGIGQEIQRWSPAPHTFVVELANARASGYVPTTDQAARGAYGAKPILSRWLCDDAGRRMADAAQVMLHRLWGE